MTGPAAVFADDVAAELDARPADVVVSDGALLGALVGAEAARRSVGGPVPEHLPPAHAGAASVRARGSARRPARWVGSRHRLLQAASARLWERGRPALNAARRRHGLDPLSSIWAQWDRAGRVVVLTSRGVRLTGAPAGQRPLRQARSSTTRSWTEPFAPPTGTEPLVVVGLSSTRMRGTVDVLRRIVSALDRLAVRAVVPTGPAVDPCRRPRYPARRRRPVGAARAAVPAGRCGHHARGARHAR